MSVFRLLLSGILIAGIAGSTIRRSTAETPTPASLTTGDSRPNILFIMSDDHAAHAISAYGSQVNQTPNIDRLAKEGILFRNCFCTNSLCGPSRAVIMTGKHSHINGFTDNKSRFDNSQPTVAGYLHDAGYETVMIGKWHLVSEPTGFDYWNILPGQGAYFDPTFIEMGRRYQIPGYVTDIITEMTLDYLEHRWDRSKPFFMMCHHKAPHRSWLPHPEWDRVPDERLPVPESFFDDGSGRGRPALEQKLSCAEDLKPFDLKRDPPEGLDAREMAIWKYQRYMNDYLRCVASVDKSVGRILDWLDSTGLADHTVVFYCGDNGFFLGDHGWFDKRFMYEESLRIPLLIRWPRGIRAGIENTDLVQNLDFAETFLDLAGHPIPGDMQGRSLSPFFQGDTPQSRENRRTSIYYRYYEFPDEHYTYPHYGIRTATDKLIFFPTLDPENPQEGWEYYDLTKDPDEYTNTYRDPANTERIAQLRKELGRLREKYGDTN
ncbi:MAG: sulfatase [Planctomycetia bacterium]|nr:sulfatase [Planctomycetia bacterium]